MKLSGYFYVLVMLCLLPLGQCLAQAHGLRFFSHEVDQDRRTGLNLAPGKMICTGGEHTLSFELSYRAGQANYYGYVFRLADTNGRSIDLICNKSTQTAQYFQLVINERFSNIKFSIPNTQLFNRWTKLHFKFDTHVGSVTLTYGGRAYADRMPIAGRSYFRLLFGANNQKGFSVTDVPPMDLRHVSIANTGDTMLNWPLDETAGNKAAETLQASHGRVTNPGWIRRMHRDWEQAASLSVAGNASTSFNGRKNIIYITGTDSVFEYDVAGRQVKATAYATGAHPALPGNQSVWVAARKEVLNYYPDQKAVASYHPDSRAWNKQFIYPDTASDYWHTNKFYSAHDTSLYIFGGYGHFKYRNQIFKYVLNTQKWAQLQPQGDFFTPRYMAALGAGNNGAYILGGFGSSQGRQELGARNLYDMMYYDARKNVFKKLYGFSPRSDFALANSMVIDEKNDTFYALAFENRKYRTHLQMIKGALHKPGYTEVGNRMPYLFHDIESFADLYYSPSLQRFIAVVLLTRDNQTSVKIYSLMAPPLVWGNNRQVINDVKQPTWLTLGSILIGMGALLVFLFVRLRKPGNEEPSSVLVNDALPLLNTPEKLPSAALRDNVLYRRPGSICLFGDFRIIDRDGLEITHLFTPLLKELFLVIFLHSARWGRAISSEKLRELLWFDKNEDSARNNRSVSIARLKTLLERLPDCHIIKQGGCWKIAINIDSVYVDYIDYLEITKDKHRPDRDRLNKLADIIQRGNFLANTEYQWLDVFKTEISNEIIDTYLQYANKVQIENDPDFLIHLSSYITYFDSVNEEAMRIRCRALAYLGKHSLARQVYTDFKREYAGIYGVEFAADLQNVLLTRKFKPLFFMKRILTNAYAVCLAGGLCLGFAILTGFSKYGQPSRAVSYTNDTITAKQQVDILHPDYKSNPLQQWEERFKAFGFYSFKQKGQVLPYRLYKPRALHGKKYPLVLFMHGAGERGADNRRQFLRFNPFQFWKNDSCYVLAPQCPEVSATGRGDDNIWVNTPFTTRYHAFKTQPTWPLQLTMALVDSLIATGNIDTKRIYITGLSMGGFATWELLHRKPGLFAAAVPVCGGGDTVTAINLTKTPLWVFHGNADDIVPETCSADMVRAISRAGCKPKYSVLPGVGHNAWDYAYPGPDIWQWIFKHRNR